MKKLGYSLFWSGFSLLVLASLIFFVINPYIIAFGKAYRFKSIGYDFQLLKSYYLVLLIISIAFKFTGIIIVCCYSRYRENKRNEAEVKSENLLSLMTCRHAVMHKCDEVKTRKHVFIKEKRKNGNKKTRT